MTIDSIKELLKSNNKEDVLLGLIMAEKLNLVKYIFTDKYKHYDIFHIPKSKVDFSAVFNNNYWYNIIGNFYGIPSAIYIIIENNVTKCDYDYR